ncbi:Probable RNA-directed DNA polymerase from transposon BS [Eumeta japonica]|uniref:Probable RNA-directed DNA polymerase from transposon BS n=1 Tax=Eumeta variegata TaxID=151549 RepID=A0A4C1V432_EUMVA|nr:Probable RNA-directed DNA polymerase from transposon BS [Eumeta japonica]
MLRMGQKLLTLEGAPSRHQGCEAHFPNLRKHSLRVKKRLLLPRRVCHSIVLDHHPTPAPSPNSKELSRLNHALLFLRFCLALARTEAHHRPRVGQRSRRAFSRSQKKKEKSGEKRKECTVANYIGNELVRLENKLNYEFKIIAHLTPIHFLNNPTKRTSTLDVSLVTSVAFNVTKTLKSEEYTPVPPLKRPDNTTAINDAEIAKCIAESIASQCSHAYPSHDISHIHYIKKEVWHKVSLELKDDRPPFYLSEVQTLVKNLKTRKVPDTDGVNNKATKCFSLLLFFLLVAIFNACLKNFTPIWKEAEVMGIHKPKKPRDLPASYRSIRLLSGLTKLYQNILKSRLSDHLFGKGLIINEKFGFRPAHSFPQQALHLVIAVLFDVTKAFDRVWHTGLTYKLLALKVPDRFIYIIDSYISNRHFVLDTKTHTRLNELSEQGFLKDPPSFLFCTSRTQTTYCARRQESNSCYSRTILRYIFLQSMKNQPSSTFRGPLMSWVDGFVPGGLRLIHMASHAPLAPPCAVLPRSM